MEQKDSFSFTIPQKQKVNGKYQDTGSQVVSVSNYNDIINFGKNLTESHSPVCSIIKNDNQLYLMVNKNFEQLKDLQIFSDAENENYNVYKLKNVTMYANEDISFALSNPDAKSFGNITIKSKGIIHEKNGVQTTLLKLESENLNVELPKNIVELTQNDAAPIQLRASKQAKRCALPAQMFETLKAMEANGSPNIKVKEWANVGKKGQTLRIALYGDRILVGDGVELKEVYAGFKVVPDMGNNGEVTDKKDLIVRFDKSSEKVGESKNSKLVDGLSPEIIKEITEFLPQEKNGEKVVDEETKADIEKMQIESIKSLTKPGIKVGINAFENTNAEPALQSLEEVNAFTPIQPEPDRPVVVEEPTPEPEPITVPDPTKEETVQEEKQENAEQPKAEDKQEDNQNGNGKDDKADGKDGKAKSKKPDDKQIPGWKLLLSGITAIIAFALCIATALMPGIPFAIPLMTGLLGAATAIPTLAASGRYVKKAIDKKAAKKKAKKAAAKDKSEEKQTDNQKAEEKAVVKEQSKKKQKDKTASKQEKINSKQEKAEKKAEVKKQNEARISQEETDQKFNDILNKTNKTIATLEDYNNYYGKDAKKAENQELYKDSKECVDELKELRNQIINAEKNNENYNKIMESAANIKSKHSNTIKAIKRTYNRSSTQEP